MKLSIQEMQELAAVRGGLCLSTAYINTDTHLQWQCGAGHQWHAIPSSVKRGSWCQLCDRLRKQPDMDQAAALAGKYGGRVLSDTPVKHLQKLRWQCSQGHTWLARVAAVRAGAWCVECYHDQMRGTLEEMHTVAAAWNGKCLSEQYISAHIHLNWQCAVGHIWAAKPATIMRSWCPACSFERKRLGIEKMREVAAMHGGQCLSEIYKNNRTLLTWKCLDGHVWEAKPQHVFRGQWCRECHHIQVSFQREKTRRQKKKLVSIPNLL